MGVAGRVGRGLANTFGGGSFVDGFMEDSDRDKFLASKAAPAPAAAARAAPASVPTLAAGAPGATPGVPPGGDRHVLAKHKGVSLEQATEDVRDIHYAINRWVEGAVLTPNAAQRPSWSSDPRYSVLFHLKQFTYSFHQTVLKRAVKELGYGNLAPMGVFAWYIPTMIAADVTKGLIQGGGELPAYMKGYDLGDWTMHGLQRSGLMGLGQIGVDANSDLSSLAGPAVEQAIDALRDPLADSTIRALPLHGLYREALR